MIMTIIIGFRLGRGCNCAIHLVVEGFFLHSGALLILIRQLKIVALLVDPAEDPVVQPHGGSSTLGGLVSSCEAVLVHDPVCLDTLGGFAAVEHKRLLDSDVLARRSQQDGLVGAGGLPVAGSGGTVWAGAVGVLAIPRAEEVPLVLSKQSLGRKIPWVALVDVDLGDDGDRAWDGGSLVHEVVDDELLICGVEAEPSWKIRQSSRARHGDKKWRLLSSDVLAVGLLCSNLYTTVYYYTHSLYYC